MSAIQPAPEGPASIEPVGTKSALRTPWLTLLICITCIGTYLWQGWTLGHFDRFSGSELATLGGNLPSLSLGPQPWRLASSLFLHVSPAHLLGNLVVTLFIAGVLETVVPRWKWMVFFLVGGLFSSFASACINDGNHDLAVLGIHVQRMYVSVGISGAIMSASGALIIFSALEWLANGRTAGKGLLRGALIITVLNLIYGFAHSGVDNTAHEFGLMFGILSSIALLMPSTRRAFWTRGLIKGAGILIFVVVMVPTAVSLWKGLPPTQERESETRNALHRITLAKAEQRASVIKAEEQRQKLAYVSESDATAWRIPIPNVAKIVPLDQDGKVLIAANGDASRIIEYDLKQGRQLRILAKADYPAGKGWGCPGPKCSAVGISNLIVDSAGTHAYASTLYKGSVSAIDLASGRIAYTMHTGTYPSRLLLHDGRLFAYDELDNTVSVMDAAKGTLIKQIRIPGAPESESRASSLSIETDSPLVSDANAMYMLTPDERLARLEYSSLAVTLLDTKQVKSIGRDGTGKPWMLTADGLYAMAPTPVLLYAFRPPAALLARSTLYGPYMNADGKHPMVLLATPDIVFGISPASNTMRRMWPLENDQDTWITNAMDGGHFYLPGSKNVQIFTMTRSMAPGEVGQAYNSLVKMAQHTHR